ncbi:MAG: ROK family protein [Proteobacteria bacterium]|nr:ROK family protein [Pseudomonadota bacterium]
MTTDLLLGFDIGGTKMAVVVGTLRGEIIRRQEFPSTSPERTRRNFIEMGHALLKEVAGGRLVGCGISAPGTMSSKRGLILEPPNMPEWRNVPVREWIATEFGVPVGMENDANAAAVAEWSWGHHKKIDNLIYLTCGTGMGAGLVLDGRLYRGKEDLAGEVGHIRLMPFGPVGFFKAGSLEGLTRGGALAELAKIRLQEPHAPSTLEAISPTALTGKDVGEAALAGDLLARAVVVESATYLGQACGLFIDILNPERISLGSIARKLGALYVDAVRAAAKKEAIPAAFESCVIDVAALGERVQDLAALAVALAAAEKTAMV